MLSFDRITAQGMRFSNFYASSPRCMPTRASLISGISPAALHMTFIPEARNDGAAGKGQLGLALRPLSPDERREAGVSEGLVVEQASGPAAHAGVQAGDVLLAINGVPARDMAQVRAAMAKAGKSVALLIERNGDKIFVPVRLG